MIPIMYKPVLSLGEPQGQATAKRAKLAPAMETAVGLQKGSIDPPWFDHMVLRSPP